MRILSGLLLLALVGRSAAQCSLADSCDECLNVARPASAAFCSWFEAANICGEGCGMEGCGATVCASDLDTCETCLGGPGYAAAGQYAWVPETEECVGSCDDAPADASCFQGKSIDNPDGYDRSICDDIVETCPLPNDNGNCDFDPTRPYKCGPDYNCLYTKKCLAEAAGFDIDEDCCQAPDPAACGLIYQPQLCGSKQCPYDNICVAELAGYSEEQCESPFAPQCGEFGTCAECLEDGFCSWSPDVGKNGACIASCDQAPADGECYSPEFGHTPETCPGSAGTACASDVLVCPTGEVYSRDPSANCEFPRCPCDGFDTCGECVEGSCSWSPEAGSGGGACLDSCLDAPADGSCYSKEYGHSAKTCPAESNLVWEQAAPTLMSRKDGDYMGSENQLDSLATRFLVSAKKSSEASGLKEAGMVKVYDLTQNGSFGNTYRQVGQTLYGFRDGDEIQGILAPNGRRLMLFTHTRDNGTGRVWIYELKSGSWVEIGKIIGQEGERFGQTAAMAKAGGVIAVGASYANNKKGAVRVYSYLGGTAWTQMGSDIEGDFVDGKFGWDIAFASDANSPTLVIGQKSDDSGDNKGRSGQARVFRWNKDKGTFRQVGDPILGASAGDSFGRQVAINADGKIFAAGSRYADGSGGRDAGAVAAYENIGGGDWTDLNTEIEGERSDDQFFNVAMNAAGDRIAVGGGSGAGQFGYVKVYEKKGSGWSQIGGTLRGQNPGENFGSNISLSPDGNHLLVGSPARDNLNIPGSVRYYELVPGGTYDHPHNPIEISSAADGMADGTRDAGTSPAAVSKKTSAIISALLAVAIPAIYL